jgi:hypothetical protein
MPTETHRGHLPWDDPDCDTLAFLTWLARHGWRFGDFNACVSADGTSWCLHWTNGPKLNHYDWIWTGRRTRILRREIRRPMTDEELHRDVDQWHDAGIARWRRAEHGGPKPATCGKRNRQAKRRGVIICWELKSRHFADDEVAQRLVDDVRASKWPAFYMALVTMRLWGQKARAIHNADGQFALLAHDAPKPDDLDRWRPFITQIWGGFR